MAAKKTLKKAAKPKTPVQKALEVTWKLNGQLKCSRMEYLRIGGMLAQVRDEKLYVELKHPDMIAYAQQRLHLGRSSLYQYLKVYDWVCRKHKEWLDPHPKGFIPDLSDVGDLIWLEDELETKGLKADTRAKLTELHTQALAGELRRAEIRKWRRARQQGQDTIDSILSSLRGARRRVARLNPAMPEVVAQLDAAISILVNARSLKVARLDDLPGWDPISSNASVA